MRKVSTRPQTRRPWSCSTSNNLLKLFAPSLTILVLCLCTISRTEKSLRRRMLTDPTDVTFLIKCMEQTVRRTKKIRIENACFDGVRKFINEDKKLIYQVHDRYKFPLREVTRKGNMLEISDRLANTFHIILPTEEALEEWYGEIYHSIHGVPTKYRRLFEKVFDVKPDTESLEKSGVPSYDEIVAEEPDFFKNLDIQTPEGRMMFVEVFHDVYRSQNDTKRWQVPQHLLSPEDFSIIKEQFALDGYKMPLTEKIDESRRDAIELVRNMFYELITLSCKENDGAPIYLLTADIEKLEYFFFPETQLKHRGPPSLTGLYPWSVGHLKKILMEKGKDSESAPFWLSMFETAIYCHSKAQPDQVLDSMSLAAYPTERYKYTCFFIDEKERLLLKQVKKGMAAVMQMIHADFIEQYTKRSQAKAMSRVPSFDQVIENANKRFKDHAENQMAHDEFVKSELMKFVKSELMKIIEARRQKIKLSSDGDDGDK